MGNTAIILAGGVSRRMDHSIPKQFMILNDKPVIIHTINNFERNKEIDSILIVCVDQWKEHMENLVKEYGLNKVKWIITGGETVHDSTRNGLYHLEGKISEDDYVIIHDAARPILPQNAIYNMMEVAYENGNASLAIPCHETILLTEDKMSGVEQLDRQRVMRVQTPQAYKFGLIKDLYKRADDDNIHDIVYADLLLVHYGERVFFSPGFTNNIKITRKEDLALCESLMKFNEEQLYVS